MTDRQDDANAAPAREGADPPGNREDLGDLVADTAVEGDALAAPDSDKPRA